MATYVAAAGRGHGFPKKIVFADLVEPNQDHTWEKCAAVSRNQVGRKVNMKNNIAAATVAQERTEAFVIRCPS
jgi:hypothetical protein